MAFSTLEVVKKDKGGKTMILWDAISPCHQEGCPINHLCPHTNKNTKCEVEVQYINAAVASIIHANKLSDAQVHHAGTILMPLYSHLVKFKLVELSLDSPLIMAKNKFHSIHPIYREIRETIKTINKVWTDLFKAEIRTLVPDIKDLLEHGDPHYQETLYKEEDKSLPRRH